MKAYPSLKISGLMWGGIGLALVLLLGVGCKIEAENLWFGTLGYSSVFSLRIKTRICLWILAFTVSVGTWVSNFYVARSNCLNNAPQSPWPQQRRMGLIALLATIAALTGILSVLIYHQITVVQELAQHLSDRPQQLPNLPPTLGWPILSRIVQAWWQNPFWFLLPIGLTVGILVAPWSALTFTGLFLSLGLGFAFNQEWARVLSAFNATRFGAQDPLFHLDIGFYVFEMPLLKLIRFWSLDIFAFTFIAITLLYLLNNNSLSKGYFTGFSVEQKQHLSALAAWFFLAVVLGYGLACMGLLYSLRGITYGAGYVDSHVQLPANLILMAGATILSGICWVGAFFPQWLSPLRTPSQRFRLWGQSVLRVSVILFCAVSLFVEQLLPSVVQRLGVEPNELARETPYILKTIAATRSAFGLDRIEARTFNPENALTLEDIAKNEATFNNIRLWDSRPLLETNRQLQQIRLYYSFPDADIDRYTLLNPEGQSIKQQVLVAARELDYNAVPPEAQTWVNQHLVYTHGYGFTLSPVNTIGDGGLPDYFIKDIGSTTTGNTALDITSDEVRASIPVGQPRIYYGGLTNTYIMTPTQVQELDYPSGNENVYNVYDGDGGVVLDSLWKRFLFAVYLRDWQMLLTRNFLPETRVLFRRSVKERIQTIAPFLNYDPDPYFVIANTDLRNVNGKIIDTAPEDARQNRNYLYWIIDGYTTTESYPYSDPGEHPYNYIRNSVKVVVDAYHGSVTFYVADESDPLIRTWEKIFPDLFRPLAEMPIALQSHIRYPSHLFNVQSERLLTYHMTDPQVFYNREDQWQIPQEIYGGEEQPIESYYLIMRLPTEDAEEFILLTPFTPVSRNNLVAWLAGRSDGQNYGRLLLYQFPKQRLIYGPEQIEARINQDPLISQQISLWNRQGSRAIQGNLLVIPLEKSLLYVEPLYLEAEKNSLPTLVRVIVAYENRIVMAETLEEALQQILQPDPIDSANALSSEKLLPKTIVRPIETP
ncbi:MAG: UPF0182 family protein [Prochlorotrichaceae cyanobacterium]